mgnify:CR=1 FL=1
MGWARLRSLPSPTSRSCSSCCRRAAFSCTTPSSRSTSACRAGAAGREGGEVVGSVQPRQGGGPHARWQGDRATGARHGSGSIGRQHAEPAAATPPPPRPPAPPPPSPPLLPTCAAASSALRWLPCCCAHSRAFWAAMRAFCVREGVWGGAQGEAGGHQGAGCGMMHAQQPMCSQLNAGQGRTAGKHAHAATTAARCSNTQCSTTSGGLPAARRRPPWLPPPPPSLPPARTQGCAAWPTGSGHPAGGRAQAQVQSARVGAQTLRKAEAHYGQRHTHPGRERIHS